MIVRASSWSQSLKVRTSAYCTMPMQAIAVVLLANPMRMANIGLAYVWLGLTKVDYQGHSPIIEEETRAVYLVNE